MHTRVHDRLQRRPPPPQKKKNPRSGKLNLYVLMSPWADTTLGINCFNKSRPQAVLALICQCARVCVCVCVRACVRACVRVCV